MAGFPFGLEELNQELAGVTEPGDELDENDFGQIQAEGLPDRPNFPVVVFVFAVLADLGTVLTAGFLGIVFSAVMLITLWIYLFGKYGGIKRWVWKRAVARLGLKSIPVLGPFLLTWSFFVLRAHSKNYKRIDQILTSVEKLMLREAKSGA